MTFAWRIAIGAAAASLVPLVFAAVIFASRRVEARERQDVLVTQEAQELTALLERLVIDMETGVRGFRVNGREAFLEPYNMAVAQYGPVFSRLDALLGSESERRIATDIRKEVEVWRTDWVEPRIAAIRASPPFVTERGLLLPALPEQLDANAGKREMDALRALFDALARAQRGRLEKELAEDARASANLSRLLWGAALGSCLLMLAGAVHLFRLFGRRVGVLFAGISAAERGGFARVPLEGHDEPARIADAFNRMVAELERRDTERRRAEEALQRSERRLHSILENAPAVIYLKDAARRYLFVNRRFESVFARKKDELIGRTNEEVFPAAVPEAYRATALEPAGADTVELEETVLEADGVHTYLSSKFVIHGPTGSDDEIGSISTDITQRKRDQEALKESEERLSLALESARMGAWDLDLVRDTAVRSLRHDQIFGYQSLQPQWGSQIFLSHVLPEDRELVKGRFQEAFASGHFDMECRILWPDQSLHWIAAQGLVYRNENGDPIRMMGLVTDVSDRKRAQEEIQQLNRELGHRVEDLKHLNSELEAFSYSVSHDLRAPLRSIDGFSQVLLGDQGERLDESGRDALGRVRAAAARMGQLIDDLLKLSRVTRAELHREKVDLSEIARAAASELSRREPDRRVEVCIAEGVTAEGDAALLRLVLENLMGNAFKFTSKRVDARVEFGMERQNGGPVYYVRDNGAGFDMAYAERLFGAFQRLHSVTEFPGTGIGLATVQRIVHRHGGHVWAQGAPGEGATFQFTL